MKVFAIILLLGVASAFTPQNYEDTARGFFSQFGASDDAVKGCFGSNEATELTKTVTDFENAMKEGWTIQKIEDLVAAVMEIKNTASDLGSTCKVASLVTEAEAFGAAISKDPKGIIEKILLTDGLKIVSKAVDARSKIESQDFHGFGQDMGGITQMVLSTQSYVAYKMVKGADELDFVVKADITDFSSGFLHGVEADETKLSYCEDNAHSMIVNFNSAVAAIKQVAKDPTQIIKVIEAVKSIVGEVEEFNPYCKATTLFGDVKALTTKTGLESLAKAYLQNWEAVDKSVISMVEAIAQKDMFHTGEHFGEVVKTLLAFSIQSEQ